jgi:hypothetical protein
MDSQCEDGIDMIWRVSADIAWDGEDETSNRPFALGSGFTADWGSSAHFDDVKDFHEFLDEA